MAALNFDVAPVAGATLQKIVDEVVRAPKDVAAAPSRSWSERSWNEPFLE